MRGDLNLITLSENQRGLVSTVSAFLLLAAGLNVPTGLPEPYTMYARYIIGIAGATGFGLQKFLQETREAAPTLFDDINTPLDAFMRLGSEEQGKLLKAEQAIYESFKDVPKPEAGRP